MRTKHRCWALRRNPVGIETGRQDQTISNHDSFLTAAALAPILSAARQRWADTGLTSEQLGVIDSLRFEVADLAGWYLGASSGRIVQLDRRATGYGWFIDATPLDDAEFTAAAGGTPGASALRRIDLLSTVLHEMGHNLGLADDYAPAARENVMYGFLVPGERRLPFRGQARDANFNGGSGTHYLFTPLNIGTLPPGLNPSADLEELPEHRFLSLQGLCLLAQ